MKREMEEEEEDCLSEHWPCVLCVCKTGTFGIWEVNGREGSSDHSMLRNSIDLTKRICLVSSGQAALEAFSPQNRCFLS